MPYRSTPHVFWVTITIFFFFLAGPVGFLFLVLWVWRASSNASYNRKLDVQWKQQMLDRVTNAYKFPLDKRGD